MIEINEDEYNALKTKANLADMLAPKVDELNNKISEMQVNNVKNNQSSHDEIDAFDEYCYNKFDKKGVKNG